ncbi:MAG: ArgE/DapE family deacylase [Nitrospinae bacterium]|nr:ArgE/DapE family deacylase [Nitrospinota bacterium]
MAQDDIQTVLGSIKRDAMLTLAQELIKIPSFKTEETEAARYLADFLRQRGYGVQLQEVEPGRFQTIAVLKGTGGGKSLMFNGHIDIDPLAFGWKRDPWTPHIDGDRLYGAGIRNMKGGVAAMIEAAEAIRRSGVKLKGDLELACVVGELQGGVGTSYLCAHGPLTDMAVVPEPNGADNILTVHAGVVEMAIHTIGTSRHISRMEDAIDAIEKMCKVIPTLKKVQFTHTPRADLPGLPRINVGVIIGGRGRDHDLRGPNFTCDVCTVLVDVRFLPGMTSTSVKADIERALNALKADDPDFRYEIELPIPAGYKVNTVVMEPFDLPKDAHILETLLRQYRRVTGREPSGVGTVLPGSYTGNDTCHLWRAGVPCLLYGPGGGSESTTVPDEYTRISDMQQVAQVLALTALDVCNLPT